MIPFFSTSFLFPSSVSGPLQGQSKGGPCYKKEFFSGHHTDAKGEEHVFAQDTRRTSSRAYTGLPGPVRYQ